MSDPSLHKREFEERAFDLTIGRAFGDDADPALAEKIVRDHHAGKQPQFSLNDLEEDRNMSNAATLDASPHAGGRVISLGLRRFTGIAACAAFAAAIGLGIAYWPEQDASRHMVVSDDQPEKSRQEERNLQINADSPNGAQGEGELRGGAFGGGGGPKDQSNDGGDGSAAVFAKNAANNPTVPVAFDFETDHANRYLCHVSTDKPIYRAGEKIFIRGVLLRASDNKPLPEGMNRPTAKIEIIGPSGEVVSTNSYVYGADSTVSGMWRVPQGQAGGMYIVKVTDQSVSYVPSERTFEIRAFRTPRLKSQLEFLKKAYGPGEKVIAALNVTRAEGGVPADAKVTAIARLDGVEIHRGSAFVNAEGQCTVSFSLPGEIVGGQGSLTLVIEDGGVKESVAKTIPVLLNRVNVDVYPESGDLIAGLTSGVYFEASTPWGEPADIEGEIVDSKGRVVTATVVTEHEGRGSARFTPTAGEQYRLRIVKPAGITEMIDLPVVVARGATLLSKDQAYERDEAVAFDLGVTEAGEYRVALFRHEEEVSALRVKMNAGQSREVMLTPPAQAQGVLRATVFNAENIPVAERLVFRRQPSDLHIEVTCERTEGYVPGEEATVKVKTTDGNGKPVSAVVGLTVTDDATLEMVETRKQAPRLPVMAMLESEVDHLEAANIYLSNDPVADTAVDLLLGTQGWRRFAYADVKAFIDANGDDARRMLAYNEEMARMRQRHGESTGFSGGAVDGVVLRTATAEGGDSDDMAPSARPMPSAPPSPDAPAVDSKAEGTKDLPSVPEETMDEQAKAMADRLEDMPAPVTEPNADPSLKDEMNDSRRGKKRAPQGGEWGLEEEETRKLEELARQTNGVTKQDKEGSQSMARTARHWVRVYAHSARKDRKADERTDFTETVYWAAALKTDATTGEVTATFDLSDSITSFRCMADGFSATGALGSADLLIESKQPFSIEPKMPFTLTSGDRVLVPVSVINNMRESLVANFTASSTRDSAKIKDGFIDEVTLAGGERGRVLVPVSIGRDNAVFNLSFTGAVGDMFSDSVKRTITVVPNGFPINSNAGGLISGDVSHTLTIPAEADPSSVVTVITLYPSPLANLQTAMERLVREPCGCFEQTSSTLYPLIMAQQYFTTRPNVNAMLVSRSNTMIENGYKKLLGYECPKKGFEWYGRDPACEPMTAYGLMEFTEMAKVHTVSGDLIKRTRDFLYGRRDGQGSFKLDKQLGSFGYAPQEINDAYIVWALSECAVSGGPESASLQLDRELEGLRKKALDGKDPYFIALVANTLHNAGDREGAHLLAVKLIQYQKENGVVQGAKTSVTCSGGDGLEIETTALATLAWLAEDTEFAVNSQKAIEWLATRCKEGRFGSTQSTILALKAILAYDALRSAARQNGNVTLKVDGKEIGAVSFTSGAEEAIQLPSFAGMMTPGEHTISLSMGEGWQMPYSVSVRYHTTKPESSEKCAVRLTATLSDEAVTEGESTEVNVTITNVKNEGVPATVAIIGMPGGLEPRHEQLQELVKAGTIAYYEVKGRDVVVYFRDMDPREVVAFSIDAIAAIPGEYTGSASRAYLYYTDEHRHWIDPLKVRIDAR